MSNQKNKSKLGGNLGSTNIDVATLRYLYDTLGMRSFLDIGCGPGGMVFNAACLGFMARGIEGDINSIPKDCPMIECVDYRRSFSSFNAPFDIGYSCEFLEHVPAEYALNYLHDFSLCNHLLITAAPPGWGGDGHVNEQEEDYWISLFKTVGFHLDENKTKIIRDISCITFNQEVRSAKKQFIKNRGLFFEKLQSNN